MDNELIVKIESLTNLGVGVAKYDGKVIFIENTAPEDVVKINITKETKKYSFGETVEILEPSPFRTNPRCAMQKICGSCQIQFIDYDAQLKIKQNIVKDCFRETDIKVLPTVASPQIWEYRCKVQVPVSETKNSKRILAGYFKKKTHEIVNIKHCPIQPLICDKIIEYIRETAFKYNVSGYFEKKHSGLLRHILMRSSSYNGNILLTLVINSSSIDSNVKEFTRDIYNHFEEITGVCINLNNKKTNLILSDRTVPIIGKDYVEEVLCGVNFQIKTNTFFQINPKSAENIFSYVKKYIKQNFEKPVVLDAYAGIATIGIIMSDISNKVVSVEENKQSIETAKQVIDENNITNVELHCEDTSKYLETVSGKVFDITILDPPRKGCSIESLENVLKVTKSKIIYISCNPQTLARDLKYLVDKGAKVSEVQPFDMFCHTNHVECATIIDVSDIN